MDNETKDAIIFCIEEEMLRNQDSKQRTINQEWNDILRNAIEQIYEL